MARPREFDHERALREAMRVFWIKGYDGATLPDLLAGMGMSRSSLYNTFGDKQALFHRTLVHYEQTIGASKRDALLHAPTARDGIRRYFDRLLEIALSGELPGGCFFTNAAASLETADEETRQRVGESLKSLERQFRDVLERGREAGDVPAKLDIPRKAALLLGLSQGVNVLARVHKDRALLEQMIEEALEGL